MSVSSPVVIQGFRGLNIREAPGSIKDEELVTCLNLNITRAGELEKRTGLTELYVGAGTPSASNMGLRQITLVGHFLTTTYSQLIAVNSDGMLYYSSDGTAWVQIAGTFNVEFGIQYADKFYMVRANGTLLEWNGVAITAIAGSPSGTHCLVNRDRLFVLNTKAAGILSSRLYFSQPGDFSTAGWPSINFLDVAQGDGDFLVATSVIQDQMLLFKGKSTWTLFIQGTTADWVLRNTNPEIGCISKYTPREIEGRLFFISSRGVYTTDGISFENISQDISPVFKDRVPSLDQLNLDSAVWYEERYICYIEISPSNYRYMVYHTRIEGWSEWEFGGPNPGYFVVLSTSSPTKGIYTGSRLDNRGRVYRYGDSTFLDAGDPYSCEIVTKDFDMATPLLMKRGKWIGVDILTGATMNWYHIVDGISKQVTDSISTETARWNDPNYTWNAPDLTWGGTGIIRRSLRKIEGPGYFRSWQFRFISIGSSTNFIFYSATLMMHQKRSVVKTVT